MIQQKYWASGWSTIVVFLLTADLSRSALPQSGTNNAGSSSNSGSTMDKAGVYKVVVNGEQVYLRVISDSGQLMGDRTDEYDDFGRPLPSTEHASCSSLSDPTCESMSTPLDRIGRRKLTPNQISSGTSDSNSQSSAHSDGLSSLLSTLFDSGSSSLQSSAKRKSVDSLNPDSLEYRLLQQNLKVPLPGGEKVFHFADQVPMFDELKHPYIHAEQHSSDSTSSQSSADSSDQSNSNEERNEEAKQEGQHPSEDSTSIVNEIGRKIANNVHESDSTVMKKLLRMSGDPSERVRVRSVTSDSNTRGSRKDLTIEHLMPVAKQSSDSLFSDAHNKGGDSSSSSTFSGDSDSELLDFFQKQLGLGNIKVSSKTVSFKDHSFKRKKNKNQDLRSNGEYMAGMLGDSNNKLSPSLGSEKKKREQGTETELKVMVATVDSPRQSTEDDSDGGKSTSLDERDAESLREQVNDMLKELLSVQSVFDKGNPQDSFDEDESAPKMDEESISELTEQVMSVLKDPAMFDGSTEVQSSEQLSEEAEVSNGGNEYDLDLEFEFTVDDPHSDVEGVEENEEEYQDWDDGDHSEDDEY